MQNDKEKALTLAQKAVEADPRSATARIALSYAQQARFDLEGARASIEEAVKLDPATGTTLVTPAGDRFFLVAAQKGALIGPLGQATTPGLYPRSASQTCP